MDNSPVRLEVYIAGLDNRVEDRDNNIKETLSENNKPPVIAL